MTHERKQRALNVSTLIVVMLLVAVGVLGPMAFRGTGPFAVAVDGRSAQSGEARVFVDAVKGNADVERAGLAMELLPGTCCVEGDVVEVRDGSEVRLGIGGVGAVVLPEGSVARICDGGVVQVMGLAPAGGLQGGSPETGSGSAAASGAVSDNGDSAGSAAVSCAVTVRCDSILSHMDKLARGKDIYVPGDGIIFESARVPLQEGESAFDVLRRICADQGIQLEFSYAPAYGSYYVEGIGNLYELDCGPESGWLFKVNGRLPNVGCSEYTLQPGDALEFVYSCEWQNDEPGMEGLS